METNSMLLSRFLLAVFLVITISCSEDNPPSIDSVIPEPNERDTDPDVVKDIESGKDTVGTVEFLNKDLVAEGFILVNDAGNNRVYLMDKNTRIHHEWTLTAGLGNDVYLLPDGRLLASLEADDTKIELGGSAGKLQFIDPDGRVVWNFDYSTENYITHHDAELLPNGNIITLVWERITKDEALLHGSKLKTDLFTEAIIEIDPNTDEIVWEWRAMDHIVQDFDPTKENYGVISENPQLIDLNYVEREEDGDIMHANGIGYDTVNDLVYVSVNFFNEVWVIDHSTTTESAALHVGGKHGKGGDLIYRFGNPEAYQNEAGERLFYSNHFPNLLQGNDLGKMLIFSNGNGLEQSTVYELQIPETLALWPHTDNEPEVVWSFTDPELFAPKVSGAVKLSNGNRLITEGDFGIWEVTHGGEIVWKFGADGFFWRAYHYEPNSQEMMALGL